MNLNGIHPDSLVHNLIEEIDINNKQLTIIYQQEETSSKNVVHKKIVNREKK